MDKENYIDKLEALSNDTTLIYNNLNILNKYLLDVNNAAVNNNNNDLYAKAIQSSDYLSLSELMQDSLDNINKKINEIIKELM